MKLWKAEKIYFQLPNATFLAFLTLFRPGGALEPYQNLKLNNFKTVKAMTTKFSYCPKIYLATFWS